MGPRRDHPPGIEITRDWIKQNFLKWKEHVLPLKQTFQTIRLLEIGVFEGLSGCWWLHNLLTKQEDFYLGIDPWVPHPHIRGVAPSKAAMVLIQRTAEKNFARYGSKAMLWRGASVDAFRPAPELAHILIPESFEVCYVDGDHGPAAAMLDSVNAWSILRPGGILIWDDWQYGPHKTPYPLHVHLRPFFRLISGRYEILWETFQLGIRKLRS